MKERKARLVVNKSGGTGKGSTFRATLPTAWVRQMGLGEEERNIKLKFDGKKVIIKKERGKKMKKYELFKNDIEISLRDKDRIVEGCTLDQGDCDPELIRSFDNKEEALSELQNYKSDIRELKGNLGTYYQVTEYYVQENTYDEDGFVEGGDVWEFTKMQELKEEK